MKHLSVSLVVQGFTPPPQFARITAETNWSLYTTVLLIELWGTQGSSKQKYPRIWKKKKDSEFVLSEQGIKFNGNHRIDSHNDAHNIHIWLENQSVIESYK